MKAKIKGSIIIQKLAYHSTLDENAHLMIFVKKHSSKSHRWERILNHNGFDIIKTTLIFILRS